MGKCRNGFLRRVDLFHQDYAEAIGFFGRELVDAAEAGGFQVFFWDTTAHELIADVSGSLDAKGTVSVVGACYLVGCTGDMHGKMLFVGDACYLIKVGQLGIVHKFVGVQLEIKIDGHTYGYPRSGS